MREDKKLSKREKLFFENRVYPVLKEFVSKGIDELLKVLKDSDIILIEDTDDKGEDCKNAHLEFYKSVRGGLFMLSLDKHTMTSDKTFFVQWSRNCGCADEVYVNMECSLDKNKVHWITDTWRK